MIPCASEFSAYPEFSDFFLCNGVDMVYNSINIYNGECQWDESCNMVIYSNNFGEWLKYSKVRILKRFAL